MQLLSWSYWFSLQGRELMPSVKLGLVVVFVALIVLGILARVASKKWYTNMYWAEGGKRVSSMGLWMGVIGLLIVACTHELVYFFGARFWYLVWLLVAAVWTFFIMRFMIVVVPKKKVEFAERARINKWIPKKS